MTDYFSPKAFIYGNSLTPSVSVAAIIPDIEEKVREALECEPGPNKVLEWGHNSKLDFHPVPYTATHIVGQHEGRHLSVSGCL